jgi:pyruvate,water dikinase
MTTTLLFSDPGADSHALSGGKGANLARMTTAGFQVPPGFIVTTAAYSEFIATGDLWPPISAHLAQIDYGNFADVDAVTERIRDLISSIPMPEGIAENVCAAYRSLGDQVYVAVRSSGTAEDLAEASFAGQHDSMLDVRGEKALLTAVQDCWASLWTSRATAYRERNGFPHQDVALAVVVQIMVAPRSSGVLFTANPMTEATNELVINSSWGLGEGIVSGVLTPDQFVLDRDTLAVKSRELGSKEVQVVRNPHGTGTLTLPVPEGQAALPSLTEGELARLGELGRGIARFYDDVPQDIEWAIAGDEFYVLQSRDVTGVEFSWDDEVLSWNNLQPESPPDTIWSRKWADFGYTGKKTPMGVSLRDEMAALMHMRAERLWGYEDVAQLRYLKYYKGEVYFNCRIDYLNQRYQLPPALRRPEMLELAPKSWFSDLTREPFSWVKLIKTFARVELTEPQLGPTRCWKNFAKITEPAEVQAAGNGLPAEQIRHLSDHQLMRYLDSRLAYQANFLHELWTIFYLQFPLAITAWTTMIQSWYKGDNPGIAADLITGLPKASSSARENLALWRFADRIRKSETLTARFATHSGRTFFEAPTEEEVCRAFLADYVEFVAEYGHRGHADRDLVHPRRVEDPGIDYSKIQSLLTADADEPQLHDQNLVRRREAAEADMIASIRKQPLSGLKVEAFKVLQAWLLEFWYLRDEERHELDRNQFSKKAPLLEINRRLVERGVLSADEIYYLSKSEAYELFKGMPRTRLVNAKIAARRRDQDRLYEEFDPPLFLKGNTPIDLDAPEIQDGADGVYRGTGTSRGTVTGIARIVPHQKDIGRVQKGDIMITTATDPGWTSVFLVISGLVLENGGMLAHGSCISREYGIPAVQLAGAKKLIKDGSTISVNGDTGEVRILAEPDTAVETPPAELQSAG